MSVRACKLLLLAGLSLAGCSNNPAADYSVRDSNGDVVATAKDVPAGTTIEQCVDPAGEFGGEAYCPDPDGDSAYAVNSADPFNGTAPTCLCLSAGDPGTGWDSVTTTAEIATYDCAPADPLVGAAATTAYVDSDDDGLGTGAASMQCGVGSGTGFAGVDGDCNDTDPLVGAAATTAYVDSDDDGYGTGDSSLVCEIGAGQATVGGDCDDSVASVKPGAVETCDGVDDDCDGSVDEGAIDAGYWYSDGDHDGHGDAALVVVICEAPEGYVGSSDDCNVGDGDVYPGAIEVCDEVDNDCDGSIDEGDVCAEPDADLDGDPDSADCAPSDPAINHSAIEVCDEVDNDCDGSIDEGDVCAEPDADLDGDPDSADCAPSDPAINHSAIEVCDEVDNDCDGSTDEDVTMTVYPDMDGDLYGAGSASWACSESAGWSVNNTDCNDGNVAVHPGVAEISFDGIDNGCTGIPNPTAIATITLTPNADQAGVSWELWLRDGTVDPTGSSTATWASGGAASGTGPLTGTITVTNGHVLFTNGPMNSYAYWAFQTTGVNVSTAFSVNGYPFTLVNTCWDGTGCPGTDGRWTVNTQ